MPRRAGGWVAALALAVVLPACGGSGNGPTPVTQPPAPVPVRTQIGSFNFTVFGTVEANRRGLIRDVALVGLTLNQAGTVEIVADWTFAINDLDIILYSGNCTPALVIAGSCNVIDAATSTSAKPERLIRAVTAGTFTIGIMNFGPLDDSGVGHVFLTR